MLVCFSQGEKGGSKGFGENKSIPKIPHKAKIF